jgi:predicted porin
MKATFRVAGVHTPVLFLAGLFGGAGSAHAQSSVTLYGLVDEGLSYVSNINGHSAIQTRSGLLDGSRFGLMGQEDLGGGYGAFFRLENGFDVSTGALQQNGRIFGRQAYVGIKTPYGSVSAGTQYDTNVDFLSPVMVYGRIVATVYDLDDGGANRRTPNAIKYMSPVINGFSFGGLYAFGGQPGAPGQNSVWSAGAGYQLGGFQFGVSALRVANPYATWFDSTGAANIATFGAYLPQATALESRGAGVRYKSGGWDVKVGMTHNVLDRSYLNANVRYDNYMLESGYAITPAWRVSGSVELTQGKVNANGQQPKYRQYDLFTDYQLTKRSSVYALASYQQAVGDATRAQIGLVPASNSRSQLLLHVAYRVMF